MASSYQKLSLAEKRALDLSRVREPSLPCPRGCGMSLMPADLLSHLEQRCPGPSEPGIGSKWVMWREAIALVPRRTLIRWVVSGLVRTRGGRGDREYLYRDLAMKVAQSRAAHRR